jgi:hypothetical protein
MELGVVPRFPLQRGLQVVERSVEEILLIV